MKVIFYIAICGMCYACLPEKELQAEMIYATLVKVQEVNRYPNVKQKVLTWEMEDAVSFITYEPSTVDIPLGTKTRVLVYK